MEDSAFIKFNSKGMKAISKKKPTLGPGEFAFIVNLNVPDGFFEYENAMTVDIKLDKEDIITPKMKVKKGGVFGGGKLHNLIVE